MVFFDSLLLVAGSAAAGLALVFIGVRGAVRIWKNTTAQSREAGRK